MQIILKEDIRTLGKAGDVVRVSEGHGRNYLLPLKKAVLATPANLKHLEAERESLGAKREKLRNEAEGLAERLRAQKVVLEREAGEEDKLFGSVTTRQIAEALAAQGGISVDHRNFHFKETIRKAGSYSVEVHLQGNVVAELSVEIKKK